MLSSPSPHMIYFDVKCLNTTKKIIFTLQSLFYNSHKFNSHKDSLNVRQKDKMQTTCKMDELLRKHATILVGNGNQS